MTGFSPSQGHMYHTFAEPGWVLVPLELRLDINHPLSLTLTVTSGIWSTFQAFVHMIYSLSGVLLSLFRIFNFP